MGVTYTALAFIGIPVDQETFFNVSRQQRIVPRSACGHKWEDQDKFCPTCGRQLGSGIQMIETADLKAQWAPFVSGAGVRYGDIRELSIRSGLGVEIITTGCSMGGDALKFFLGKPLGRMDVSRDPVPELWEEGFDLSKIGTLFIVTAEALGEMGIKDPPRFYIREHVG